MKQIPRYPKYFVTEDGRVWSTYGKGRWLRPGLCKNGRLTVRLYKDGQGKSYWVHRLVILSFGGKDGGDSSAGDSPSRCFSHGCSSTPVDRDPGPSGSVSDVYHGEYHV